MRRISIFIFWLIGWKAIESPPAGIDKAILLVAPHTSNWDAFIGLLVFTAMGLRLHWLAKQSLFKWPLGPILRFTGAIPVNRSQSQNFIEYSKQALEAFEKRKFEDQDFVAVFIDGKHLAKQQMIIALGVTIKGDKIPLGVIQSTTENATAIKGLLTDLIDRGLNYEDGLLFIIDGAKGMRKAIDDVFGHKVIIQRCQWHKRENVVSYLNEKDQVAYRKKLQKAYSEDDYHKAKQELNIIKSELGQINRQAANSLKEGMEETLTIQRLGLNEYLSKSFTTTNCIESVNSQLVKYIRKVKRWMNSDQRYRWVVCGLLEIETRLRKVNNYQYPATNRSISQQDGFFSF